MKKIIIDPKILNRWLQAKIELHSDKLTDSELRQIREYEQNNPCKYCTEFLIEKTDDNEDSYPCAICGIKDTEKEN